MNTAMWNFFRLYHRGGSGRSSKSIIQRITVGPWRVDEMNPTSSRTLRSTANRESLNKCAFCNIYGWVRTDPADFWARIRPGLMSTAQEFITLQSSPAIHLIRLSKNISAWQEKDPYCKDETIGMEFAYLDLVKNSVCFLKSTTKTNRRSGSLNKK